MRSFGCVVRVTLPKEALGKLDDRGVGYKYGDGEASGSHGLDLGRVGTSHFMKGPLPCCLTIDPSRRSKM